MAQISDRRLHQSLWAFVGLGVGLRLLRFLLKFPLSGDEAKLSLSWIDRGFLELLEPLEAWQIAPGLFMWSNLAVVRLLGFSEHSLRLLPLVLGVASVLLMRHLALRSLPRVAALLTVAVFSVSYYPIRLASEAKPYSADLFFSLVLTILAVEAWKQPRQLRWLVGLAIVAPIAIGISFPSVFIVGGVGLALLPTIWRQGRWRQRLAWSAFAGLSLAAFAFFWFWLIQGQFQRAAEIAANLSYWDAGFPSLEDPFGIPRWLLTAHTGRTFSYPLGTENGGSVLSFACFVLGAAGCMEMLAEVPGETGAVVVTSDFRVVTTPNLVDRLRWNMDHPDGVLPH